MNYSTTYVYYALLLASSAYAFWAGGAPERIAAALLALGSIASFALSSAPAQRFSSVESGILIVDILAFAAFATVAIRASRIWPIWATALLGMGPLAHLARWYAPDMTRWAYAVSITLWSYVIIALIAIGTFGHQRRLARFGSDPDWSSNSPIAPRARG